MRLVHALGAAVAATTLVASVAQATVTATLVQIPVDPGAAATIGGGQTVRTFQLKVVQNAEKFDVANLQTTLGSTGGLSGYFYANPTVHSNTTAEDRRYLDPGQTAASPSFYDTNLATPVYDQTPTAGTAASHLAVTGSADFPTGPGSITPVVPSTSGNSNAANRTVNAVWGDPQGGAASNTTNTAGNAASTYTIAQFTVVGNTGAFLNGYFGGSLTANNAQMFTNIYMPIAGDTDGDHIVGLSDLNTVEGHLGTNGGLAVGDIDGDGIIGLSDLNIVEGNLGISLAGPGVALGSVVPEPTSLALLGLAGLIGLRRRSVK